MTELIQMKTGGLITFGKVDMGASVLGSILGLEVLHQTSDALLSRGDQVDRLHRRKWLSPLLDRLNNCKKS